jgi:hypothetical protein
VCAASRRGGCPARRIASATDDRPSLLKDLFQYWGPLVADFAATSMARVGRVLTDAHGPHPVLLLGAGASVSSGVPTAAQLAEMAARWAYCSEHGRAAEDPTVTRSDWLPWLRSHSWYDGETAPGEQYPRVIEHLLRPRSERRWFFTQVLRQGLEPSPGYGALARLAGKGWLRTLLTTNFDDLAPRALRAEASVVAVDEVSGANEAHLVSTAPAYPQVVFLHGRVEQYTDVNLETETETLDSALRAALVPLLRDHPLIVVGYRGAERSIMVDLLGHADSVLHFPHGVYWCVRELNAEQMHPLVSDLADRLGGNFQLVKIPGFDQALIAWDEVASADVARLAGAPADRVPELRPAAPASLDELDWTLVEDSLREYGERLEWDVPSAPTREWLVGRLNQLGMVTTGATPTPTRVGMLAFGRSRQVAVEIEHVGGRETLVGNVLSTLARTLEILAELNPPFRLKGPSSTTVRAFPPAALKEVVANAFVHRDYNDLSPIRITITDHALQIVNPGGLVPDLPPSRLGEPGARAYRNPLLADFCFGVGAIDKAGSGLTNVRRWCEGNAGAASFGPRRENTVFVVAIQSRPERPDPATGTADPGDTTQTFLTNVCPLLLEDATVYIAISDARSARDIVRAAHDPIPPFVIDGGRLITFADPIDYPSLLAPRATAPSNGSQWQT